MSFERGFSFGMRYSNVLLVSFRQEFGHEGPKDFPSSNT